MNKMILSEFERIARSRFQFEGVYQSPEITVTDQDHPFDSRNFHESIHLACLKLFDDGHFQECVFKAFKQVEIQVKRKSGVASGQGFDLMMSVFNEKNPKLRFNALVTESEKNEQLGFRHMFAGVFSGVRNPRGHDDVPDTLDQCLEHLSLASYLMRQLDRAEKVE
jgi:uncharacterized protein (TIGR02391 family)